MHIPSCFLRHFVPAAAILLLSGLPAFSADPPAPQVLTGVIVEVTTGDAFLLRTADNREIPVGVWGIDSPEVNNRTGQQARKFTARLIEGESVSITVRARSGEGRLLGKVTFSGNRDLDEELLKEGFAVWVTGVAPDEKTYDRAQADAQDARKGIWREWLPKKGL